MTRWLVPALAAALPLHAAIITERNDVFSSFPESAVFRGTSAAPGIESQWIPYGTYTGGNGGTEYLRVTSNLVGIVASAFDGYWERCNIAYQSLTNRQYGAVGELWTNDTQRILDHLNTRGLQIAHRGDGTYTTNLWTTALLEDDLNPATGIYAEIFGSRALDTLCGSVAPPVPVSWTPDFQAFLSQTNDWANVWPTYAAVTNDGYIITNRTTYSRYHVWNFLDSLSQYAGSDYASAVDSLMTALDGIPAASSLTNVLAVDTGWTTNDFKHWRNMSTRLNWKRLGLICQLERQMETSYDYWGGGELPFYSFGAYLRRGYSGILGGVTVHIPSDARGAYAVCEVTPEPELANFQWELRTNAVEVTTNRLGRYFPTARFDGNTDRSASYENDYTGGGDNFGWGSGSIFANFSADIERALAGNVPSFASTYHFRLEVQIADSTVSTGLAYTFGNIQLISPIGITFRLGGGGIGWGQPPAGQTLSPVDLYLAAETGKSASAAYTVSDAARLVTNLDLSVTFNDTNFWNGGWIASRSLPTLEMMISTTNSVDDAPSPGTNGSERVFRMSPESPENARSATELRSMRASAVRSLDRAVKAKFAELAGQGVEGLASARAQFAPGEEQHLWDWLGRQTPRLALQCSSKPTIELTGTFESQGDNNARNVRVDGETGIGAYEFGSWQLSFESGSYGVSTNTTPVRVDGHQSQVLKTLWRFKNLRDPNL